MTDAGPLPDAGDVIATQAAFDTAVHAQPAVVVTATLASPPAAGLEAPFAPSAYAQGSGVGGGGTGGGVGAGGGAGGGGAGGGGGVGGGGDGGGGGTALCETVNVRPAIKTVPTRASPSFCAIPTDTGPLPAPLFPALIAIQDDCDAAVQPQPASVSTATETVLAAGDTDVFGGAIPKRHGAAS